MLASGRLRFPVILAAAVLAACHDPIASNHLPRVPGEQAHSARSAAWLDLRPLTAFGDLANPTGVDFHTYEGSRQVVHPDVVRMPSAWNGSPFWAAITPYPGGDRNVENPSIFASDDGEGWSLPAGLVNPVVRTKRGHLSDPDIVHDPATNALVLFYREVVLRSGTHANDYIMRLTSRDGIRWTQPRLVLSSRGKYFVSPTVTIGPDRTWRMWSVDAGDQGCSTSKTRVIMLSSSNGQTFSRARIIPLAQPGYLIWHMDIQYIPSLREYWALYAAFRPSETCSSTSLFFARSPDGIKWQTFPAPVLARDAVPYFSMNVYRSTFAYDASSDEVTFWFSGARLMSFTTEDGGEGSVPYWSAAVGRTSRQALFMRVTQRAPAVASPHPSMRGYITPDDGW